MKTFPASQPKLPCLGFCSVLFQFLSLEAYPQLLSSQVSFPRNCNHFIVCSQDFVKLCQQHGSEHFQLQPLNLPAQCLMPNHGSQLFKMVTINTQLLDSEYEWGKCKPQNSCEIVWWSVCKFSWNCFSLSPL